MGFVYVPNLHNSDSNGTLLQGFAVLANKLEKTNFKSQNTSNLGQFDPFSPKTGKRDFPDKSGSVTFEHLSPPNFMQKNRKN